jgi:hypothetical protein
MEVKKERQGVVATVGIARFAVWPRDCSMYMSSLALIVGCFDGFSNDNHNQIRYQTRPAAPETTGHTYVVRDCTSYYSLPNRRNKYLKFRFVFWVIYTAV